MSGKAIHYDMLATLGGSAPAYSVVNSWLAEFKIWRNSVEDQHRSECCKDAASTEKFKLLRTC